MKAIDPGIEETVDYGDRSFTYARVDHWRCAWSEQANMNPDEGPKHFGMTTRVMPPDDEPITVEVFLQAFYRKSREAGLQARYSHTMGTCMRVCRPPHLRGRKRFDPKDLQAAPY